MYNLTIILIFLIASAIWKEEEKPSRVPKPFPGGRRGLVPWEQRAAGGTKAPLPRAVAPRREPAGQGGASAAPSCIPKRRFHRLFTCSSNLVGKTRKAEGYLRSVLYVFPDGGGLYFPLTRRYVIYGESIHHWRRRRVPLFTPFFYPRPSQAPRMRRLPFSDTLELYIKKETWRKQVHITLL